MKKLQLVLTALGFMLLAGCSKPDHTELYRELKSVDKMVFATMSITKTAKSESEEWYTIGKRIAVYSYDTYMRAYIDLSALQLDDIVFDERNKTVKVTLPPVVTEITGRDMKMTKVYENIGLMRSDLDSKERAEIKEQANKSLKKEVGENPMFRDRLAEAAKSKARKYFAAIFEANGYTPSIEFKPSDF